MTGFDPSAVDPRHWQTADLAGAPARWLRLARLGTSDTSLGLLESGAWAAGRERIRVVDRQHAAPALLPALERSADWLRSELRARAAAVGLPASLVDAFPIAWVIEAGLGSESDPPPRPARVARTLAGRDHDGASPPSSTAGNWRAVSIATSIW